MQMWQSKTAILVATFMLAILPIVTFATDYSSSSYILRDPVVTPGGGYASSSSFQYFSSIAQTVIGESSSSTFESTSGFLYFATVSVPVLSGTAGDAQAGLSWTASSGSLGLNVSAYEVGQSTTSGSGYIYTNVGNVLNSNRTSLTNGTTYYFVVRALDAFGEAVVTSNEISIVPVASGGGGSSGGGGGGSYVTRPVNLLFTPRPGECFQPDLNCDTRIELIDFSILIFWFEKNGFPREMDLNNDGIIDIVDFSIMTYYWTEI